MKKHYLLSILMLAMMAAMMPAGAFAQDIPLDTAALYEHPDTTIAIVPDSNGIIYVTQEGAGLRNGSSWENATPWLSYALNCADTMAAKPLIWVAKGTYYGIPQEYDGAIYAFIGPSGVSVYGGFTGNEPADYNLSLRDFEQNETVLDGLLTHNVLSVTNSEWNGFSIRRGTNGCEMKVSSVMRKCSISGCSGNGVSSSYISSSRNPIIDSCEITQNGGVGINGQTLIVSNSIIRNNGEGGVSAGVAHHCIITNNVGYGFRSPYGGGIHHSLLANNDGTGVFSLRGYCDYNTIVNNGVDGVSSNVTTIRNCIIFGNGGRSIRGSSYELMHCAIDGNYIRSSYSNIPLGDTNAPTVFQPGFVHPTEGTGSSYSDGDWHLLPTSVCINRGNAESDNLSETDLEGNPRVQQGIPDIGAYESPYDHPDEGRIIYVKTDGTGDGTSWGNATSDLDYAIETAWVYGPTTRIWVAEGMYPTPNRPYYVKENLHLKGGFAGNEPADYDVDLRNTMAHATILDGQQQNRVLHQTMDFAYPALVDGFTLTHGNADEGAGACLMKGTTLSKCTLVNNIASENSAALYASEDTLKQLVVANNNGTGIEVGNSQLLHCVVVRNSGDGICLSGETVQDSNLIYNSIIWGNGLRNLHFTSAMAQNNTPVQHCAIGHQIVSGAENITLTSDNSDGAGPHFILPTDTAGVVNVLGNWQLDSASVCLNSGLELSDFYGIRTDIAGQSRVQNSRADIGAWESPFQTQVLCRNEEVTLYEGESYTFYDTTLTTSGWYTHRWNVGEADSLVTLHLIVKQVVYVSVEGAGSRDGSSWANALDGQTATANGSTKLADALQLATVGTEFWIQSGTYYACSDSDVNKSFVLNEGVALYGGFDGTETTFAQRDTANAPTVFSGNLQNDTLMENYSRHIFITNEANTPENPIILDNIAITQGYNTIYEGCALQINASSPIQASHCHIHHNLSGEVINDHHTHYFGGAIVNEGFLSCMCCTLDSNEIYGANFDRGGAALVNQMSGVVHIHHSKISHNHAPNIGALYNKGIMEIDSSDISYNKALQGRFGAIKNENLLFITNSVLLANWSYTAVSTISSSGKLKLHNCIVDSNQSSRITPEYYRLIPNSGNGGCGCSHISIEGTADVQNCLFRGNNQNATPEGGCLHVNGDASIKKCHFLGNYGADVYRNPGTAMITTVFENPEGDGVGVYVESGNAVVEDCLFDGNFGGGGTSAGVKSGRLNMNRCVFTRESLLRSSASRGVLSIKSGELFVQNSLFANNQNVIFNTANSPGASNTIFTNCTFVNNHDILCEFNSNHSNNVIDSEYYCSDVGAYIVGDTARILFNNGIIVGNWGHSVRTLGNNGNTFYPNFTLQFTNTLFDSIRTNPIAETPDSNLVPDSLGNLYYCNPMFVNPTTVAGIDSTQNPLEADFRLLPASPCINSGDTTGLHLTASSTDLAGNHRIMRCLIDRGCYEYGTIVYDTVHESLCVGPEETEATAYEGHGFSLTQLPVGESSFTRECDCHPDANDTVLTLRITVQPSVAAETESTACDSFVWNDTVYYRPGDYTQTFPAANGCDSIITLHLTMYQSLIVQQELNLCEDDLPYHYVNGDIDTTFEVGTPNLSVFNFQFSTAHGCDSTVILTLTITPSDTTGIITYDDGTFAIYPNPTNGIVTLQLTPETCNLKPEIQIFDIYGKRLQVMSVTDERTQIDLSSYAPGVYLIQLVGDGRVIGVRKVVRR